MASDKIHKTLRIIEKYKTAANRSHSHGWFKGTRSKLVINSEAYTIR